MTRSAFEILFSLNSFLYKLNVISWETWEPFINLDSMEYVDAYCERLNARKSDD